MDSTVRKEAPSSATRFLLKCIKEGRKLRVRILSDGYEKDWNVQFPKNLRQEGTQYLVDAVRPAANGSFYRVLGNIYTKNN